LRAAGLGLDAETANIEVKRWLRTVANERRHGTTSEIPRERWEEERAHLMKLAPQYPGLLSSTKPQEHLWRTVPPLQHPLSVYEALVESAA
jgi:hypothetical protein